MTATAPDTARQGPQWIEGAPNSLLGTLRLVESLKRLKRQGWLVAGIPSGECESVADHSYGAALIALLTAERAGADPTRVALMLLLHDLPEALVGDLTPGDGVAREEKYRRERDALTAILAPLPASQRRALVELWEEFDRGSTRDARCAREIDVFERVFQALFYETMLGAAPEGLRPNDAPQMAKRMERETVRDALERFWADLDAKIDSPFYQALAATLWEQKLELDE